MLKIGPGLDFLTGMGANPPKPGAPRPMPGHICVTMQGYDPNLVTGILMQHGIDSTRLAITSNGEERPLCQGHDESCWSQNRRDEFVITAGDRQLAMHP